MRSLRVSRCRSRLGASDGGERSHCREHTLERQADLKCSIDLALRSGARVLPVAVDLPTAEGEASRMLSSSFPGSPDDVAALTEWLMSIESTSGAEED